MTKFFHLSSQYNDELANFIDSKEWYEPYVNYTITSDWNGSGEGGCKVFYPKQHIFPYDVFKHTNIPSCDYRKVDLGLKDENGKTIYFADKNIGASNPTDVGFLFIPGNTTGVKKTHELKIRIQDLWEKFNQPINEGGPTMVELVNSLISSIDPSGTYLPPCDITTFYFYYTEMLNTEYGTALVETGKVEDDELFKTEWIKSTPSYGFVSNMSNEEFPQDKTYDPAVKYMGGKWQTPSLDILNRLSELDQQFVHNYKNTGKNGLLITGTNNNKLFLPCCRCHGASEMKNVGSNLDVFDDDFSKFYGGDNYMGIYNSSTINSVEDYNKLVKINKFMFSESNGYIDGDVTFNRVPTRAIWIE